ncbi:magnesium transporter [uncultured Dysgonomonas sp.]|uniref:magnesium transporter n=1 Tax=uncultured Dysgonomonas sp. TaxID=206096 RepID=UPI000A4676E1|nr:magnesium transporter [uncultured Dysgonomonas sp.]
MLQFNDIRKKVKNKGFSIFSMFGKDRYKIHPAEFASAIDSMSFDHALLSFMELPYDTQVSVFSYLNVLLQHKLVRSLSPQRAGYLLNHLSSDDRTVFFSGLSVSERSKYISYLDEKNKKSTQDFLGYPKNSIAWHIDTNFTVLSKDMTIAEASAHLRAFQKDTEAANVIYVADEAGKLLDDIQVRRLVLNVPTMKISEIMDGSFVSLNVTDTKETAIHKFKAYDRVVMPVINDDNLLLGVITIDDIMDIAEQKDTSDIQKFGGVEDLDYPYVKTGFFTLTRKRATWLVILFLGEMLTATAMGHFEAEISKAVVLALFVPLIISSGGNSGSQAATLIIRALALKELTLKDWWFVMRREIFSGFTLGMILGSIGFLRISLWQYLHWFNYGEHWALIATTVFCSLVGIVMWGTLSGSMIPIVLKKCKIDPATSSAPFVATLVDVTGLVIYFSIAAVILKGTLL